MERRIFLAVFLSFLVVYAYQALFIPPEPPRPREQAAEPPPAPAAPVEPIPTPVPAPPPAARPVVSETAERDVVIETDTVRAVFTNRGGRIKQWLLKVYAQDESGRPVDLVPTSLDPDQPLPFSLRVDEGSLTRTLNSALYRTTHTGNDVTFEYEDASGLHVRKQFALDPERYVITFTADVRQGPQVLNPFVQWGPGLGDAGATSGGGSFFTGNYVQPPQAILHDGNDVVRNAATSIPEQPVHEGTFRFAGVDDHYFIAAAVNPGPARIEYRQVTLPGSTDPNTQRQLVAHAYRFPQPPSGVQFFFGPKAFDVLKSVDAELVRAIHFGVFAWLAVPLLGALQWVHGFVGNYGWAIVILTILINLAIFPLRHKSVVSMRKMQELQPQLKAIQGRYADLKVTDPARQKMNTEVMNLYRQKGVNPASGCVPMLLTLPVLFAFYSFLSVAIELRGAAFGLWITDLSQPDPYYVTPILMAASMFWQQRITPTSADPTQQRIMLMMPIVFSVMFLSAPSGLVLYWFVSNLWAIGQQYFTNWLLGPMPVHAVRPAAERRVKSAGSGKTAGAKK
ncbi:MAG: membrane protein insertase YidC [Vicinamibacterales bacterium]